MTWCKPFKSSQVTGQDLRSAILVAVTIFSASLKSLKRVSRLPITELMNTSFENMTGPDKDTPSNSDAPCTLL